MVVASWLDTTTAALTKPNADAEWVEDLESLAEIRNAIVAAGVDEKAVAQILSECFRGLAISVLTILDGGTQLSERGRVVAVDENGDQLGDDLHNEFVTYLIESGRLT